MIEVHGPRAGPRTTPHSDCSEPNRAESAFVMKLQTEQTGVANLEM
jgi:hypothetical protein